MYEKFLLTALLTSLLISAGLSKSILRAFDYSDDPPPKVVHYIIGNWDNDMDSRGCVLLDDDNKLKVKGVITIGDNDMSQYKPMHVYTAFTGTTPHLSGPIEMNDLVQLILPNGQIVYTYTFTAYLGDFNSYCADTPEMPFPFDYEISVVDEFGAPYPFEDYPDLFSPMGLPNPGTDNTQIIYNGSIHSGTKDICCPVYFGSSSSQKSAQKNIGDIDINNNEFLDASVFPNPFSDILNITLHSNSNSDSTIQISDVNGRIVGEYTHSAKYSKQKGIEINTSNLEPGFYYCSIKSNDQTKTFKVLKLLR